VTAQNVCGPDRDTAAEEVPLVVRAYRDVEREREGNGVPVVGIVRDAVAGLGTFSRTSARVYSADMKNRAG